MREVGGVVGAGIRWESCGSFWRGEEFMGNSTYYKYICSIMFVNDENAFELFSSGVVQPIKL